MVTAVGRDRRTVSAVRYAADNDCLVGCGHPELAVRARRYPAGLLTLSSRCEMEPDIPEMGQQCAD
jgi:hypothetical protein